MAMLGVLKGGLVESLSQTWHRADIVRISSLADSYILLTVRHDSHFKHQAGQHTMFRLKENGHDVLYYFSIASAPRADRLMDFCIAYHPQSRIYKIMQGLKAGATLAMSSPVGEFVATEENRPIVFVAGGSGIAPIRSLLQRYIGNKDHKAPLSLIYGCRSDVAIPYRGELLQWQEENPHRFKVQFCAENSNDPAIPNGRVTDCLPEFFNPDAAYYICGPNPMVDAVDGFLTKRGIAKDDIHYERYN